MNVSSLGVFFFFFCSFEKSTLAMAGYQNGVFPCLLFALLSRSRGVVRKRNGNSRFLARLAPISC